MLGREEYRARDAVDLDIVWTTARERVPELLALIEPLIRPESGESSEDE